MYLFTIYNTSTGQILGNYASSQDIRSDVATALGVSYIDGHYSDETHYVSGGVATVRPTNNVTCSKLTYTVGADPIDTIQLSGYPTNCTMSINGNAPFTDGSGPTDITFDAVGTYTIKLSLFPYIDKEFEIVAS